MAAAIRSMKQYLSLVETRVKDAERRYKNQFITDPNAPNAGKDAPDAEDH